MAGLDSWSEPLLGSSFENVEPRTIVILRKVKTFLPGTDKILAALYTIFLLWQTVVLVPYTIHAVHCCFRSKQVSFKCNESSVPYALKIELAMMISLNMHMMLILWFVRKFPNFLGYKSIFKKLIRIPSFLSMMLKLVVLLVSLVISVHFTTNVFLLQLLLTLMFACQAVLIVALVGTFNFTRGKPALEKYPFYVYVLFKATLLVLLEENFLFFGLVTLQLAVGVAAIDRDVEKTMQDAYGVLRSGAVVLFYYQVSCFLWCKMFKDRRNILSLGNDYLECKSALVQPESP